ncbi:histidine phosphatase family protein [Sporosarcina pasteurii]|uniref:Phosphoglyceromutase n=1 Tax=Sporosarcina pasteurii TaxID=1474 RepID=A0A380C6M9_SPOPA|nr:histidine phosphatase family protein [Sporosarcina pasteurii]MDS9471818.1 histidine phosphatase family protein [Sporosarcina pasteurii]SUJ13963.1 Phosphoglyceromutase [Sporosarcina pasteurii]
MTTIGFIRHGITEWNKEGRIQGSIDIPLCEEGIQMSKDLSKRLGFKKWHAIYTSPMRRAKMTATIIASELQLTHVIEDSRIREIHEGKFEGTTEEERIKKWGKSWSTLALGTENEIDVIARGISFIEAIKKNYPNENVLVITHGSFIKKMLQRLVPYDEFDEEPENTSISIVTLKEVNHCSVYNCMKHHKE